MSFAILFRSKDKSCHRIEPADVRMGQLDKTNFAWLDIDLTQKDDLESYLSAMGLPEQEVGDIADLKVDYFFWPGQRLIVNLMNVADEEDGRIKSTPLLIAWTDRLILTAHKGSSMHIEYVLDKCEESFKSVGKSPGFIYFLLWDTIVDQFLPQIRYIDDILEKIEDKYLHGDHSTHILDEIISSKQMVRTLKQSLSPMQRSMRRLVNIKLELINEEAHRYLLGLFDHMDRIAHNIDSLQDRVHATLAGYTSILSQQISSSMKVLTIIATIMMPLSLLAAIYGTNFPYIPEFTWRYSYFVFWTVLILLAGGMLYVFKRKRWL